MRIISKIKGSKVPQGTPSGAGNNLGAGPNKCKRIRTWLYKSVNSRFGLEANWVQKHIAECPRCTRRLAAVGRVSLALSLLMRANAQAIGVLKHSLRQAPKALKLKKTLPAPRLLERWGKYGHSLANIAACIFILLLMKVGVFSSADRLQSEGEKAVKQYYASQVGEDLAITVLRPIHVFTSRVIALDTEKVAVSQLPPI